MRILIHSILISLTTIVLQSCSHFLGEPDATFPLPKGYPRIEREDSLVTYNFSDFSFQYSSDGRLFHDTIVSGDVPFSFFYKEFNARVDCHYINDRDKLKQTLHYFHKALAEKQAQPHTKIHESEYSNEEHDIHGSLYYIDGQYFGPYQICLTDSTSYLLTGTLYYHENVNADSIYATTQSLKVDLMNLMETFENKSSK